MSTLSLGMDGIPNRSMRWLIDQLPPTPGSTFQPFENHNFQIEIRLICYYEML